MSLPPMGADDAKRPCFVLLGDSHAGAISASLDALAREKGVSGAAAIIEGYFPLPEAWMPGRNRSAAVNEQWQQSVIEWIREHRPANVILCGFWPWYVPYRDGVFGVIHGIEPTSVDDVRAQPTDLFSSGLESMIAECDQIDATLWFFHAAPAAKHSMKQLGIQSRVTGRAVELEGIDRQTHDRWNSAYRSAFEQVSKNGVVAVDLAGLFFDKSGRSKVGGDDQCWFADQHHLSEEGVRVFVQPLLEKVVEEMDCLGANRK
jgi:lysophospholipase L1-like esterase